MSRKKKSVSFCRSPQGKAEETGIEAKLRAHHLAPPEDLFLMQKKEAPAGIYASLAPLASRAYAPAL